MRSEWPELHAVIVTRGDVDLTEVLDSIPFPTHVWNNAERYDVAVWGRYAAITWLPDNAVVYVQDDDCVLPIDSIEEIVESYEPGVITANNPQRFRHDFYADHCLVGFGAIFDKKLTDVLLRFEKLHNNEKENVPGWLPWYQRTCDIPFTLLNERKLVDVPYADLPWAHAQNRMWKQAQHVGERTGMVELARRAREQWNGR